MNIKNIKVENMSDAEFVSWMYMERDREKSIHERFGWSNWALFGLLLSDLIYTYSLITNGGWRDNCLINVISLIGGCLGLIINILPIILLFTRNRLLDSTRVRKLRDEMPICFLLYVFFSSFVISIIYAYIYFFRQEDCLVTLFSWLTLTLLWSIALANRRINGNHFVIAWDRMTFFINRRLDLIYITICSIVFNYSAVRSFSCISKLESYQIELSVGILGLIIISFLIIQLNYNPSDKTNIDLIIDSVIFKDMSKNDAYRKILITRLGYKPIDYVWSMVVEMEKSQKLVNNYIQKLLSLQNDIKKADKILLERYNEIVEILNRSIEISKNSITMNSNLLNQVKELNSLQTTLYDKDYYEFTKNIDSYLVQAKELVNLANDNINMLNVWVTKNKCNRYGGFCLDYNCKERNKPLPIYKRMKNRVTSWILMQKYKRLDSNKKRC